MCLCKHPSVCMCVSCVLVPTEARGQYQVSCNWNFRWLSAIMETQVLWGACRALNSWATSPDQCPCLSWGTAPIVPSHSHGTLGQSALCSRVSTVHPTTRSDLTSRSTTVFCNMAAALLSACQAHTCGSTTQCSDHTYANPIYLTSCSLTGSDRTDSFNI